MPVISKPKKKLLSPGRPLLRYPGGKFRGAKKIFEFIPADTKEICSPFLGGGSVELLCANNGMKVYGYDKFLPLVDFWDCLIKKPDELAQLVAGWWSTGTMEFVKEKTVKGRVIPSKWVAGLSKDYEKKDPITKKHENYRKLKEELLSPEPSQLERAALFYVINRTSFSGSALSGGITLGNPRFTESSVQRILEFKDANKTKNITVECLDFTKSIEKNKQKLMYLDPPYWLESKLYGEKGDLNFQEKDHLVLFEILTKIKKWVLSYNDSKKVREIYHDYRIVPMEWAYGMKNYNGPTKNKKGEKIKKKKKKQMPKSSEVLILNGI